MSERLLSVCSLLSPLLFYLIARSIISVISYTFIPVLLAAAALPRMSLQLGQQLTIASAPVNLESSVRSPAVHMAKSGKAVPTPPPYPQHQALSLALSISTNS